MEIPVNYRAVVLAAVAAYAFSWLWYAALSTVSARKTKDKPKWTFELVPYLIAAVAYLLMSWMLAGLMGHLANVTVRGGIMAAFFVWAGFVLTTTLLWIYRKRKCSVWRVGTFALAAFALHMIFMLLYGKLWPRYFWLGITFGYVALAAALMMMPSRLRITAIACAILGIVVFRGYEKPEANRDFALATRSWAEERLHAVQLVDTLPGLPIASQNWNSFDDVLYLARGERYAVYEPGVMALERREFLSIVNTFASDAGSPFVEATVAACDNLAPAAEHIRIYRCSGAFWEKYEGALPLM